MMTPAEYAQDPTYHWSTLIDVGTRTYEVTETYARAKDLRAFIERHRLVAIAELETKWGIIVRPCDCVVRFLRSLHTLSYQEYLDYDED